MHGVCTTDARVISEQALVRPGRFDRLVRINLPDEDGRLAILKVHTALSSPPRPLTAPPHPAAPHLIPPASRVLAPLAHPLTRTPGPRFRAPDSHP